MHVSYIELHFPHAAMCLEEIRVRLDLGWQLTQVRGPRHGPFVLVFRKDQDE